MNKFLKILKIGDVLLIICICLAIIMSMFVLKRPIGQGASVSILQDGKPVYNLSLSESRSINVNGPLGITRIRIEKGQVWITDAPCPQKICQRIGKISRAGSVIICVPNKILVEVNGDSKQELDSVTQ
jgi:hypothetical protein